MGARGGEQPAWVVAVPPFTGSAAAVSAAVTPVKRLTDIGSDYFAWADGGKTITWAIGSTFFRRSFDTIDFGPSEPASDTAKPAAATRRKETRGNEKADREGSARSRQKRRACRGRRRDPACDAQGVVVLRRYDHHVEGDEVINGGDIVVTDNRITAIGRGAKAPPTLRVIDVRGKFITLGLRR